MFDTWKWIVDSITRHSTEIIYAVMLGAGLFALCILHVSRQMRKSRMKHISLLIIPVVVLAAAHVSAQVPGDAAVQAQWFTGTLEAPSPAFPKAGLIGVEPYVIYQRNTGDYDTAGTRLEVPHDIRQMNSETLIKYGITDRLSVQAVAAFAHVWNDQTTFTGVEDLPMEFDYRFNDENNKTGLPSITASVGISFPIGDYQGLQSSLAGLGSGAFTLKEGLLAQSLFDSPGHHPVRLRLYGVGYEPAADVSLHDVSVYGSHAGFVGHAAPGLSGILGIGGGYGLTRRWVLAFDFVQTLAHGSMLVGTDGGTPVNQQAAGSAQSSIAPAVEYNFSGHVGLIAGEELSIAGRNSSSYFAPQIALSIAY